jgi:hypothetical protein
MKHGEILSAGGEPAVGDDRKVIGRDAPASRGAHDRGADDLAAGAKT